MEKVKKIQQFVAAGGAAEVLSVDRHTILNYLKRGIFPGARRLPSGHWRIPLAEVSKLTEGAHGK